jgi:hypothetical protein
MRQRFDRPSPKLAARRRDQRSNDSNEGVDRGAPAPDRAAPGPIEVMRVA